MANNFILGSVLAGAVVFGFLRGHSTQRDEPVTIPPAASGQSATAPRPIQKNVVAYYTGDADMTAAKRKGNATLPRFRELVAAGTPGVHAVKFPLTLNGATEHIWMQMTADQGDRLVGLLSNTPVNGTKYKMGDTVTVAVADVEDWMINTGSEIYGGFTARVALDQLPKEEQDKYRPMFRD